MGELENRADGSERVDLSAEPMPDTGQLSRYINAVIRLDREKMRELRLKRAGVRLERKRKKSRIKVF
jgi:hypothetical protein